MTNWPSMTRHSAKSLPRRPLVLAMSPRGLFHQHPASSPKIYSQKIQGRKSPLRWEHQAEILHACPKHVFGHTYKVPAWNPQTPGRGQFMQVWVKKYVAWLHILITICTSHGSHDIPQTRCSDGPVNRNEKIIVVTHITANSKLLQLPFSFRHYLSLAFILISKYLHFKFSIPFSIPTSDTSYNPSKVSPDCSDSTRILRTFVTLVLTQP